MLTAGAVVFLILFIICIVEWSSTVFSGQRGPWQPAVVSGLIFAMFMAARIWTYGE